MGKMNNDYDRASVINASSKGVNRMNVCDEVDAKTREGYLLTKTVYISQFDSLQMSDMQYLI